MEPSWQQPLILWQEQTCKRLIWWSLLSLRSKEMWQSIQLHQWNMSSESEWWKDRKRDRKCLRVRAGADSKQSQWVRSGLGTLVSPQGLWHWSLGALGGLAGHRASILPLVCREPQDAAPAVLAVLLQDTTAPDLLPAAAAAAAVHLPGQTPVRGEALVGHTHERGLTLFQLLAGGGQHRQGGTGVT